MLSFPFPCKIFSIMSTSDETPIRTRLIQSEQWPDVHDDNKYSNKRREDLPSFLWHTSCYLPCNILMSCTLISKRVRILHAMVGIEIMILCRRVVTMNININIKSMKKIAASDITRVFDYIY